MKTRGLARFNNKRDANEPEIISALESEGVKVFKLDKPADLLCSIDEITFLVEVKTDKGKQTDFQKNFEQTWKGIYFIARSKDDIKNIIKEIKKA